MDNDYEFGVQRGSGSTGSVSRAQLWVAVVVVVLAVIGALVGLQVLRNEPQSAARASEVASLSAEVSSLRALVASLNASLLAVRAQQSAEVSALSDGLERLAAPDAHPCTLQCQHAGLPAPDCAACRDCDHGWTGLRCHIPLTCVAQCSDGTAHVDESDYPLLNATACSCLNGGVLNASTCSCDCAPGWSGPTCALIDTAVGARVEVDFLNALLNASDASDVDGWQRRSPSALARVPSAVGSGRRAVSGRLTQPLLVLDTAAAERFTDPRGAEYAVPSGLSLDVLPSSAPLPPARHEVFARVSDWTARLFDWQRSSTVVPSSLALQHSTASAVFNAFFVADAALGVSAVQVALYQTQLRADLSAYALTPQLQQALDYLAAYDYPTRADLYFTFFDHVGTSVVIKSLAGGSVERHVRCTSALWNETGVGARVRDNSFVREQLEVAWSDATGQGSSTKQDVRFVNHVDYARQICRGGAAVERDCAQLSDLGAWRSSLWSLPVPVVDSVVSIARLVRSASLQPRFQRALADYLDAQLKHYRDN